MAHSLERVSSIFCISELFWTALTRYFDYNSFMDSDDRSMCTTPAGDEIDLSVLNTVLASVLLVVMFRYLPIDSVVQRIPLLGGNELLVDTEFRDNRVFFGLLVVISSFILLVLTRRKFHSVKPRLADALSIAAAGALFSSTAAVLYFEKLKGVLWFGFGANVALLTVVFVVIVHRTFTSNDPSQIAIPTEISYIFWIIFATVYLPSFLQFTNGLIDLPHSRYVLNEMAAPSAGMVPLSDFTSQYSSLMGYPLLLVAAFNKSIVNTLLPYWISFLTLAVIGSLAYLLKRFFHELPLGICLIFPTCLLLVKQSPNETLGGSLAFLMSALPVRSFFPVICGLYLVVAIQKSFRIVQSMLLGLFSGLAVLNNFEFGLTSSLALTITVTALLLFRHINFRNWLFFLGSLFVTLFSCSVLFKLSGNQFQFSRWTAFSSGFKGGFGNAPMPFFGTFVLIFCLLASGVVLGFHLLRSEQKFQRNKSRVDLAVAPPSLLLYAGCWGVFSLPYYVARSITSGQLQIFLIPITMVIIGLVAHFCSVQTTNKILISIPILRKSTFIRTFPLLFIMCLPFASLLQHPDPSFEWARLMGKGTSFSSSTVKELEVVKEIERYKLYNQNAELGLVTNFANLVSIATDILPIMDANDFSDLQINRNLQISFCDSFNDAATNVILVERAVVGPDSLSSMCTSLNFKFRDTFGALDVYSK